jgi:hypothetical protein
MIDQGQVGGTLPFEDRTARQVQALRSGWPMPCRLRHLDSGKQPGLTSRFRHRFAARTPEIQPMQLYPGMLGVLAQAQPRGRRLIKMPVPIARSIALLNRPGISGDSDP